MSCFYTGKFNFYVTKHHLAELIACYLMWKCKVYEVTNTESMRETNSRCFFAILIIFGLSKMAIYLHLCLIL